MHTSFKQFLVEEEKTIYFTFGRMNPPTIGHGKLLEALAKKASKNPYRIFLSQSTDAKKNPLSYQDKVKAVRKMFPRHARSVMYNKKVRNAMEAASVMYDEGYKNVVMVVGSDRINEFSALLKKYNGKEGRHGFYNFKNINVVSAGERDPDAEGVEGMSASKMRSFAQNNDFTSFSQGLPKTVSNPDAKKMFNDVRKGMGLKEQKEFKNHIQLEPVSELREAYLRDNIFEVGEEVVITDKGIVGKIKHLGTNYLVVESKGETWRCWLDGVSKLDPNFKPSWEVEDLKIGVMTEATDRWYKDQPEWGTPESTKKAKKMTPGQMKEDIFDTADFSVEKQGQMTVSLDDLNEAERKKESPQDPDIDDRPGTQPKAYHAGLSKAQKVSRDRQFKKQSKMDDNNPAAYKPAAGDKTTKTKPSKHTKKFKDMFGEDDSSQVRMAKIRIQREKERNARKHDRMLDRARTRDTNRKNRETK
jgi:nicotinamide mononucleotide adenylyltransferase